MYDDDLAFWKMTKHRSAARSIALSRSLWRSCWSNYLKYSSMRHTVSRDVNGESSTKNLRIQTLLVIIWDVHFCAHASPKPTVMFMTSLLSSGYESRIAQREHTLRVRERIRLDCAGSDVHLQLTLVCTGRWLRARIFVSISSRCCNVRTLWRKSTVLHDQLFP